MSRCCRLHRLLSGLSFSQVDRIMLGLSDFTSTGTFILHLSVKLPKS